MLWSGEIKPRVSLALDQCCNEVWIKKTSMQLAIIDTKALAVAISIKVWKKIRLASGFHPLTTTTGAALLNRNELSQLRRGWSLRMRSFKSQILGEGKTSFTLEINVLKIFEVYHTMKAKTSFQLEFIPYILVCANSWFVINPWWVKIKQCIV